MGSMGRPKQRQQSNNKVNVLDLSLVGINFGKKASAKYNTAAIQSIENPTETNAINTSISGCHQLLNKLTLAIQFANYLLSQWQILNFSSIHKKRKWNTKWFKQSQNSMPKLFLFQFFQRFKRFYRI